MERTIEEIYKLIVIKRDNAINDKERTHKNNYICINGKKIYNVSDKEHELKGEIEAYTDVLCLLESSGVVDDELIR